MDPSEALAWLAQSMPLALGPSWLKFKLMLKGIRQLENCGSRCELLDTGNSGGIPSN